MPTGRMSASPFSKVFEMAMRGKVPLGPFSFERLDLRNEAEIDCEVELSVTLANNMPNATLSAEAASYDSADLAAISAGIRARLAL